MPRILEFYTRQAPAFILNDHIQTIRRSLDINHLQELHHVVTVELASRSISDPAICVNPELSCASVTELQALLDEIMRQVVRLMSSWRDSCREARCVNSTWTGVRELTYISLVTVSRRLPGRWSPMTKGAGTDSTLMRTENVRGTGSMLLRMRYRSMRTHRPAMTGSGTRTNARSIKTHPWRYSMYVWVQEPDLIIVLLLEPAL